MLDPALVGSECQACRQPRHDAPQPLFPLYALEPLQSRQLLPQGGSFCPRRLQVILPRHIASCSFDLLTAAHLGPQLSLQLLELLALRRPSLFGLLAPAHLRTQLPPEVRQLLWVSRRAGSGRHRRCRRGCLPDLHSRHHLLLLLAIGVAPHRQLRSGAVGRRAEGAAARTPPPGAGLAPLQRRQQRPLERLLLLALRLKGCLQLEQPRALGGRVLRLRPPRATATNARRREIRATPHERQHAGGGRVQRRGAAARGQLIARCRCVPALSGEAGVGGGGADHALLLLLLRGWCGRRDRLPVLHRSLQHLLRLSRVAVVVDARIAAGSGRRRRWRRRPPRHRAETGQPALSGRTRLTLLRLREALWSRRCLACFRHFR